MHIVENARQGQVVVDFHGEREEAVGIDPWPVTEAGENGSNVTGHKMRLLADGLVGHAREARLAGSDGGGSTGTIDNVVNGDRSDG